MSDLFTDTNPSFTNESYNASIERFVPSNGSILSRTFLISNIHCASEGSYSFILGLTLLTSTISICNALSFAIFTVFLVKFPDPLLLDTTPPFATDIFSDSSISLFMNESINAKSCSRILYAEFFASYALYASR